MTWTAPSKTNVGLNWSDNAANETGYVVERSQSATGPFTQLVTVPSDTSSFVDGAVSRKTTYYYRVKASNANGTSNYSNVVSAYVK